MLEHEVSGASYGRLGQRLLEDGPHRPQCLLLVGDQIYVDGTAGLFDPNALLYFNSGIIPKPTQSNGQAVVSANQPINVPGGYLQRALAVRGLMGGVQGIQPPTAVAPVGR